MESADWGSRKRSRWLLHFKGTESRGGRVMVRNRDDLRIVCRRRRRRLRPGRGFRQRHGHFFTTESPEDSAAGATGAAEDTHATMHQQLEALQRQIKALQGSIGLQPGLVMVPALGGAPLANPSRKTHSTLLLL